MDSLLVLRIRIEKMRMRIHALTELWWAMNSIKKKSLTGSSSKLGKQFLMRIQKTKIMRIRNADF
jgi:hypothetical protein